MRMYEKLKTLKDKLQKMKSNRANRQTGQTFHFSPFSRKQKQVLTWWCKESPVHDMDGVIADGAIRSGKTISMSLSFVMWAMSTFTGQNFAMCGKTIGSFRRNVLFWLKLIPCMSDESFGGNVSGVAMEFKLLGMENITKIKTRYYKKGLRKRIRIFCNYLALHGISIDPSGITMTFTRALPKNLLEISQIVANLWGKVSRKTLLSQVPFVDDVDEELKALETEEEENLKRQQEVFGLQDNTPPEQDPDDKEKVDE